MQGDQRECCSGRNACNRISSDSGNLYSELDKETDEREEVIELEIIWADLYARPGETRKSRASHVWELSQIPGKSVAGVKSSRTYCAFQGANSKVSLKNLW